MNLRAWFQKFLAWIGKRPKRPALSEREARLLSHVILRDHPQRYDIDRLKR